MFKSNIKASVFSYLWASLIGAIGFLVVIGPYVLSPFNVDWVWQVEWATYQIPWQFFKHEGWHWPIGSISGLLWPMGASVATTDALPLVAVPMKLFFSWVERDFQYLGPYLFVCFVLQSCFSFKIVYSLTQNRIFSIIGSAFFVFAPIFISRNHHIALCSHYVLLWAIYLALQFGRSDYKNFPLTGLFAVNVVTALVHAYWLFATMFITLFMLVFYLLKDVSKRRFVFTMSFGLIQLGAVLGLYYLTGFFAMKGIGENEWGYGNANLLSFLDPMTRPVLLPNITLFSDGQREASSYLGLGMIVLSVFGLTQIFRRVLVIRWRKYTHLLLAALGLWFLALSSSITFSKWEIVNLDFLYTIFGPIPQMLRSSGRMIVILHYCIFMFALWCLYKAPQFKLRTKNMLLGFFLALNLFDTHAIIAHQKIRGASPTMQFMSEELKSYLNFQLQQEDEMLPIHLVDFDPSCPRPPFFLETWVQYPVMNWAARNKVPVTAGSEARMPYDRIQTFCKDAYQSLVDKNPMKLLYIFNPVYWHHYAAHIDPSHCEVFPDAIVCKF
ncbi:hypothetical protein GW915_09750 [bacterium]|nr:hypothetical protein [bacterium]